MPRPDLFDNTFYAWLEANGVVLGDVVGASRDDTRFAATINLNTLKIGVGELVNIHTTHEVDHEGEFNEDCMLCHRELAVIDALSTEEEATDGGERPEEA